MPLKRRRDGRASRSRGSGCRDEDNRRYRVAVPSTANRRIQADDAPGDLAIVQSFLNTAATGTGDRARPDLLANPEALRRWAIEVGLSAVGTPPEDPEYAVESLRHLRRALRATLVAGGGGDSIDADVRLRLDDEGTVRIATEGGGTSIAGQVLGIVLAAQIRGDWRRLKICALAACSAAYYDRSKNTSSRYHTPWCANVVNLRASRQRKRLNQT